MSNLSKQRLEKDMSALYQASLDQDFDEEDRMAIGSVFKKLLPIVRDVADHGLLFEKRTQAILRLHNSIDFDTALPAVQRLGALLAKKQLLMAEKIGAVCRDDTGTDEDQKNNTRLPQLFQSLRCDSYEQKSLDEIEQELIEQQSDSPPDSPPPLVRTASVSMTTAPTPRNTPEPLSNTTTVNEREEKDEDDDSPIQIGGGTCMFDEDLDTAITEDVNNNASDENADDLTLPQQPVLERTKTLRKLDVSERSPLEPYRHAPIWNTIKYVEESRRPQFWKPFDGFAQVVMEELIAKEEVDSMFKAFSNKKLFFKLSCFSLGSLVHFSDHAPAAAHRTKCKQLFDDIVQFALEEREPTKTFIQTNEECRSVAYWQKFCRITANGMLRFGGEDHVAEQLTPSFFAQSFKWDPATLGALAHMAIHAMAPAREQFKMLFDTFIETVLAWNDDVTDDGVFYPTQNTDGGW